MQAYYCQQSLTRNSPGSGAQVLTQAVAVGGLLWALKVCLSYLDPYREQRDQVGRFMA